MKKNKIIKNKRTETKKWYSFLNWLDPFTYLDLFLNKVFGEPKTTDKQIIFWLIYIIFAFGVAYLLYSVIGLILGSGMPLATVVSGSMEPTFKRGDIVILGSPKNIDAQVIDFNENIANKDLSSFAEMTYRKNEYGLDEIDTITIANQTIKIDDIRTNKNSVIVYVSNIRGIPIIHRTVGIINANDGTYVMTKGDNKKTNRFIDQDCEVSEFTGKPTKGCLNLYLVNTKDLVGKKIGLIPYIGYIKLFLFG